MRDHDPGRLESLEARGDRRLRAVVERARRLVEEQDARLRGDRARDQEALPLATRERPRRPPTTKVCMPIGIARMSSSSPAMRAASHASSRVRTSSCRRCSRRCCRAAAGRSARRRPSAGGRRGRRGRPGPCRRTRPSRSRAARSRAAAGAASTSRSPTARRARRTRRARRGSVTLVEHQRAVRRRSGTRPRVRSIAPRSWPGSAASVLGLGNGCEDRPRPLPDRDRRATTLTTAAPEAAGSPPRPAANAVLKATNSPAESSRPAGPRDEEDQRRREQRPGGREGASAPGSVRWRGRRPRFMRANQWPQTREGARLRARDAQLGDRPEELDAGAVLVARAPPEAGAACGSIERPMRTTTATATSATARPGAQDRVEDDHERAVRRRAMKPASTIVVDRRGERLADRVDAQRPGGQVAGRVAAEERGRQAEQAVPDRRLAATVETQSLEPEPRDALHDRERRGAERDARRAAARGRRAGASSRAGTTSANSAPATIGGDEGEQARAAIPSSEQARQVPPPGAEGEAQQVAAAERPRRQRPVERMRLRRERRGDCAIDARAGAAACGSTTS